jgi:hypothetical protein
MNGLKVRDSKIEGKGLFADKEFNEGDIIGIAHINDVATSMIGRFHNHSDNPNAHSISIGNKRYLAALRPLMKGEEITVDYRRQPELEQPEEFRKGGLVKMPKPSKKGLASKKYTKSLLGTNRLFTKNPLYEKPKSKKNRVYDPNAKYYQDGGFVQLDRAPGNKFKKDAGGRWVYESGAPVTDTMILQELNYGKGKPIGSPVVQSAPKYEAKVPMSNAERKQKIGDLRMSPQISDQQEADRLFEVQREQDIYYPDVSDQLMRPPKNMNDLKGTEWIVNSSLGFPMNKARLAADAAAGPNDDPVDNFRHANAGRYTAEAIEDAVSNPMSHFQFLAPAVGFIGSNLSGIGHELSTLFGGMDDRDWGTKLRESGEDIYNNYVGSKVGASNMTPEEKTNYLLYLSETNQLPDGIEGGKNRKGQTNNMYFKKGPNDPGKYKSSYQKGGQPDPKTSFYSVEGSDGVYRKVGNTWEVDWNRSGNFQPLSKGDVAKRTAVLNSQAKPLYDSTYDDIYTTRQSAYTEKPKAAPVKNVTPQDKAVQEKFDKAFAVTGKSNMEVVEDKIQKGIDDYTKYHQEQTGKPLTQEEYNDAYRDIYNRAYVNAGVYKPTMSGPTINPYSMKQAGPAEKPQEFWDKAGDIISNPMTSAGFLIRGQAIPDYMQRNMDRGTFGYYANGQFHTERNPLDLAVADATGLSLVNDARNVYKGIENRDVAQAGLGALGFIPGVTELKNAGKAIKFAGPMKHTYQDVPEVLNALRQRGQYWDNTGAVGKDLLHPDMINYHGTYSGRPLVEVRMPDGSSEMFYKSSGWAKKAGEGVDGTTEGMWQVFGGHADTPKTSNWFIKDDNVVVPGLSYKDYYGSNTFKSMAENMDNALMQKLNFKTVDELDNAFNFKNRFGDVDSYTPKQTGGEYQDGGESKRYKTRFDKEYAEQFPKEDWAQYVQEEPGVVVRPLTSEQQQARNMDFFRMEMARRNPHLYLPDGTLRPQAAQSANWVFAAPMVAPMALEALGSVAATQIPGTGLSVGTAANTAAGIHGATQVPQRIQDWQDVAEGKKDWREATAESLMTALELYGGFSELKGFKGVPKELPGSPNNTANIQKAGMLNPFAIADAIVPRLPHPVKIPLMGATPEGLGPFTGSPLNFIPGYGKTLGKPGNAFRKFGNTMEYVQDSKTLSPKGGSPLRIGRDQIVSEGNWAALGEPWENYPGTFAAEFDFAAPGSNLGYVNPSRRNGVLITDRAQNTLVDIPVSDPGLSFHRRLPFSNRYVPINKEKLLNNQFQLATQGGHFQSLVEKYGYGLAYAAMLGAMGNDEAVKTYNKYTIDPVIKEAKKLLNYNNK